jgi:hypothetical protein
VGIVALDAGGKINTYTVTELGLVEDVFHDRTPLAKLSGNKSIKPAAKIQRTPALWACMACISALIARVAAPLPAPAMACRVLIKPGVENRVTMAMVDDARNVTKVVGLFSCTGCRTDRLL